MGAFDVSDTVFNVLRAVSNEIVFSGSGTYFSSMTNSVPKDSPIVFLAFLVQIDSTNREHTIARSDHPAAQEKYSPAASRNTQQEPWSLVRDHYGQGWVKCGRELGSAAALLLLAAGLS